LLSALCPLLNQQNAVGADGHAPGAERAEQLLLVSVKPAFAIIKQNEIVAGGREFGEADRG
jgi:hypothetical protein